MDDAKAAIDAAQGAFAEWAARKPRERAEILRKAFELLVRDAERFAKLITIENGKALSDSAARSAIPAIAEPAPSTLELVKASLAFNQLTSTERSEAISLASKADITINPRYGTFDADRVSFDPSTPNWIKTEPTPEPTATQG